ncbi:ABC transporter substrate-binding protein [Tyzzerella sp. OttesenSCG-928-J15]|nr:ABC transporter substrate-binding protein [Tyzzerella sp. OttesenSCG-928-J15]
MKKRLLAAFLTAGLIVGSLTGCGGSNNEPAKSEPAPATSESAAPAASESAAPAQSDTPAAPEASGKDTVKMAVYSDFTIFDPMNSGMTLDAVVYRNIFDCLLNFYDGEYEKTLVDDYNISDDGLSYTFNLKQGVLFHNGEELKASDVVFSMNRAKESTSYGNYTKSIANVEATDEYTVVITLSEPYVPFLQAVCAGVQIMNEKAVNDSGDNVGFEPIGTGPYKYVQFDPGQQVVLEANSEWHGGDVSIKNAVFTVLTDPSSALMAVEAGDVDLTYSIPPIEALRLDSDDKLKFDRNATLGSGYICYNLEKAPFNDVNFRLALAHAIDKQEIIDVALEGMGESSSGVWDSRYEGFSGKYPPADYDLDKAEEYLAQSSYAGETIYFRVGYENYKKIAVVVQEQLRKIGINVEVEQLEANAWVDDMKKGNYDMSTIVMTYDLDIDYWANVFHSNAIGAYNFPRLNRPEVDEAFDTGKTILDKDERIATYEVIEQVVNEEAVVIPVYFRVNPCVYSKELNITRAYPNGFAKCVDMSWN